MRSCDDIGNYAPSCRSFAFPCRIPENRRRRLARRNGRDWDFAAVRSGHRECGSVSKRSPLLKPTFGRQIAPGGIRPGRFRETDGDSCCPERFEFRKNIWPNRHQHHSSAKSESSRSAYSRILAPLTCKSDVSRSSDTMETGRRSTTVQTSSCRGSPSFARLHAKRRQSFSTTSRISSWKFRWEP